MKSLFILLAITACAYADISHLGYDYHAAPVMAIELPLPNNNYLPPEAVKIQPLPTTMHLSPVSEVAPKNTYIPPTPVKTIPLPITMFSPPAHVIAPKKTYIPPKASKPSNDYLPPFTLIKMYLPPVPVLPPKPVQIPTAPHKSYLPPVPVAPKQTPNHSYLPPLKESTPAKRIITPPATRLEDLVPPQPPQNHYEDSKVFTEDGYMTVRKHKY